MGELDRYEKFEIDEIYTNGLIYCEIHEIEHSRDVNCPYCMSNQIDETILKEAL